MFKKSSKCINSLCIEIDTNFKSSSSYLAGACVGVDAKPKAGIGGFSSDTEIGEEKVAVRNSKNLDLVILFTYDEWRVFVVGVKNGEFDI